MTIAEELAKEATVREMRIAEYDHEPDIVKQERKALYAVLAEAGRRGCYEYVKSAADKAWKDAKEIYFDEYHKYLFD